MEHISAVNWDRISCDWSAINSVDHCHSSGLSAFSFPALCLGAPGKIVGSLTGFFGRLEGGVLASGCGVESADRTAAESGTIVADCGT